MNIRVSVYGVTIAERTMNGYVPGITAIVLTPDELHELHEQTHGHPLARVEVTVTIDPREVSGGASAA